MIEMLVCMLKTSFSVFRLFICISCFRLGQGLGSYDQVNYSIAWNSLTNKETTAKTLKDFKRCLRKFDTDKINFEPILAITNNRDTDYKYF